MQGSVRERKDCRLCGVAVRKVFSLKPTPIANDYPKSPRVTKSYPMHLMECEKCGHVQQRYVLTGLFKDYKYQTPQTVAAYLAPVARRIAKDHPGARVLEVGSNNGVFLDCLAAEGLEAWGVDPANSHPRGVKAYFGEEFAKTLKRKFDVIVANNVFAHIDDLDDVFRGVNILLETDGELIFEVQYLVDLLKSGAFDMIYHEHLDYHHLDPLISFLIKHKLVMTEWEHIKTHGGSIRVHAKKMGKWCEVPKENLDWIGFKKKIRECRDRLHKEIDSAGGKVKAFGAPAKATTLVSEFGLDGKVEFTVDDTPQKQGRYIPGTSIKIKPVSELGDGPVLLFAWNYAGEIAKRIPNRLILPFEARDNRS